MMVHGYDMVYGYLVSTVYSLIDDLSTHVRIDLLKKRLESKGSTEADSSYISARSQGGRTCPLTRDLS
jgi:hypothetical protein